MGQGVVSHDAECFTSTFTVRAGDDWSVDVNKLVGLFMADAREQDVVSKHSESTWNERASQRRRRGRIRKTGKEIQDEEDVNPI
jgi:hypothetical protein